VRVVTPRGVLVLRPSAPLLARTQGAARVASAARAVGAVPYAIDCFPGSAAAHVLAGLGLTAAGRGLLGQIVYRLAPTELALTVVALATAREPTARAIARIVCDSLGLELADVAPTGGAA
jgi:hypothetical protein